jgi:hypothetical protein
MDAMSGSPSPWRVFAKTPMHASEIADSEIVSVDVRVMDMLRFADARLCPYLRLIIVVGT